MKISQNTAILFVLLGVLGCSVSSVFGRITTASGPVTAMYRMLFTSLLLLPVILVRHRSDLKAVGRRDLCFSVLSGIFLGGHFACYLTALKYTSVASCVVLVDTEVVFVAVFLVLFIKEKLSRQASAGIILSLTGSIVIALADHSSAGSGSHVLTGDMLAIAGAVCSAVYTMIGAGIRKRLSTTVYTFIVYTAAAFILFTGCLLFGERLGGYPVADYLSCLGMAVFCTLLGHSLFIHSLARVSPAFVSMAKLGEPVFSSITAMLLFSEIPGTVKIAGGLSVITGILIYIKSIKKK